MASQLDPALLQQYAIRGDDDDLAEAVGGASLVAGKVVSVKSMGREGEGEGAAMLYQARWGVG